MVTSKKTPRIQDQLTLATVCMMAISVKGNFFYNYKVYLDLL